MQAPALAVAPAVTDPWAVVSAYYGLIENGEYWAAWNMGSQAFMDQNG